MMGQQEVIDYLKKHMKGTNRQMSEKLKIRSNNVSRVTKILFSDGTLKRDIIEEKGKKSFLYSLRN